ncbi:hypothetical protein NHX12_012384 [Muraenolepis orangiensis]|uniref:Death domain-containing protein n=1 Tax=Muraenolepis orangiensis TaxID=630683 RepID=A0A9Q0DCX4_9TELE|nr:hypothetical protein NHX12_012384 [Muraenolepis orangiensis]
MAEESQRDCELLRSLRPKLIDILSADPEFVLQHAHSLHLVTHNGYQRVKPQVIPTEKVTTLLDLVYERGPEAVHGLLELLKGDLCQENFPKLSFLKSPDVDLQLYKEETSKRSTKASAEEPRAANQPPKSVTEKRLMTVAGKIARNWRQVGILVLDISSEKLDDIDADNPQQTMKAFNMLRTWRNCPKNKEATAAKLYSLLSHEDLGIAPESLSCLQESS